MPDMQPSAPSTAGADAAALPVFEESDFALGCECADPALQIERWAQEARGAADAN